MSENEVVCTSLVLPRRRTKKIFAITTIKAATQPEAKGAKPEGGDSVDHNVVPNIFIQIQ